MNLVRFLVIASILSIILGEFGKYPFGNVGSSINILDILVALTGGFFLIWKISISKKIDFPRIFWFILLFIGIGTISLLVNLNFAGGLYLARFSLYGLLFWIAYSLWSENSNHFFQLQNFLISTGVLLSILGFAQLIFIPNLSFLTDYGYDPHIFRLSGTFLDPNFLGSFLSLIYALSLILYLRTKKNYYLFWMFLFFISIVLTFSRSTWLFLGVINLFTVWFFPKKVVVGLIILILLSVLFFPRVQQRLTGAFRIDVSAHERFGSWEKGWQLFKVNPVLGIGFNNIRSVSIENSLLKPFTSDGGNSGGGVDSSWLLVLATTGLTGFIFFVVFYFTLVFTFLKKYIHSKNKTYLIAGGLLIGFLLNSQFINSFFYPPMMVVFFLLSGGLYASLSKKP